MTHLRAFLRDHRRLALLLLALALCVKALVPAGFMVGGGPTVLTIEICADASGGKLTRQVVVPHSDDGSGAAKSSAACPYAGLGMQGLAGADPVLLALALAFIVALGFAPVHAASPQSARHLRPPLRGPPALA